MSNGRSRRPAPKLLGGRPARRPARQAPQANPATPPARDAAQSPSGLEVQIYQLADDSLFKPNRADGTGWDWGWAELQRPWMDATPSRHAYRCLPLSIINQLGWWVRNPVGFNATWSGLTGPGSILFQFDTAADIWAPWINNQFGEGIITWNTPFLFRTRPEGSRLLVLGPANHFVPHAHPLTALIESDWMSMSFTMNWKLTEPGVTARFEAGDPLFQAIPLLGNPCADLEQSIVTYQHLADAPDVERAYHEWSDSRSGFHDRKARGDVKADSWQRDYFGGRDTTGRVVAPAHFTKVRPPSIQYTGTASPPNGQPAAQPPPPSPRLAATEPSSMPAAPPPAQPAQSPAITSQTPRIDDDWRRWIAENLLLHGSLESMLEAMTRAGLDPAESEREIELAVQSPYLKGADRLTNRLRKRDWLLATYRKLNRLHPSSPQVARRHRPTRDEFLRDYYTANRPVVITGMIDDWPALQRWSLDDFAARFGDREVEVQTGREAGADYETRRERYARTMPFGEFVHKVRTAGVTNDFYLTANNNSRNKDVLAELWNDIGPIAEYLDTTTPRAGFLWFGPAGTITPFHHDLTNNFMAQVLGRKRVLIAPSWDMPLMANDFHVFSRVDGRAISPSPAPPPDSPQILECILNPGEILFLPIGCLHFVEGLEISVTISFTNFAFDNDFSSNYSTYHEV